jgi:nicotinamide mononucleotide adenylyltransferase
MWIFQSSGLPAYLHLRVFDMAVDYVRLNTDFEVMGGYMNHVSE